MKITKRIEKKYIDNPNNCPFCKAPDLRAGRIDCEDLNLVSRKITCEGCHREWVEEFTLTAIHSLHEPIE